MSIEIMQCCNKCKSERKLDYTSGGRDTIVAHPHFRGWRQIEGKDICPDCMKLFLENTS